MVELDIHQDIKDKLKTFIVEKKIPHIIFYGPSGCGKRYILRFFITNIYQTVDNIKRYVMYINCAHSKGIRFIRDELKFFAKTNIHLQHGNIFKSIVLFNADKLTTDAQSALRRCIEQFSHTTRFFIVIENQNKLLKPILSRFCNIFIRLPIIDGKETSLHLYKKRFIQAKYNKLKNKRNTWLINQLDKKSNYTTIEKCLSFFTTGGVERARLSAGGGSKLELATGGTIGNLTLCGLTAGGNEENCGLSLNSATALQMGVDNGAGTAALRMQMSSVPSQAITFAVNAGGTGMPALVVTDNTGGTTTTTHGIKVPFSAGAVLGGLARESLNSISNWQDGHLGNCERLYFTATDFHPTTLDPSAGWDIGHDSSIGTPPTYAYGALTWIATKLMPVGFKIGSSSNINIMGYWARSGGCLGTQISSLTLTATTISNTGQPFTTTCFPIGMNWPIIQNLAIALLSPNILNVNHQVTGPSLTSGMGVSSAPIAQGPTLMITIKVVLAPAGSSLPLAPDIAQNEGITGAYIDIIRA